MRYNLKIGSKVESLPRAKIYNIQMFVLIRQAGRAHDGVTRLPCSKLRAAHVSSCCFAGKIRGEAVKGHRARLRRSGPLAGPIDRKRPGTAWRLTQDPKMDFQ